MTGQIINDFCPACHQRTLFIGDGGHITCSWLKCPDPTVFSYLEPKLAGLPTNAFAHLGKEIGDLVCSKQVAYGDSFGRSGNVMRELYPEGIRPEQYDDALSVVRIVDKLFRIATKKDAFGESPYRDIAGYGLLGAARDGKTMAKHGKQPVTP